MATVSETGWPYVQHRGGRPGFLRVVDAHTLAFADYKGNRQLLSTGNVATNDRVSLFLMDYPRRERLKILGHARVADITSQLVEQLVELDFRSSVERLFFIDVVSFDWNCPKFITPRYSAVEVEAIHSPLRRRIAELEVAWKGDIVGSVNVPPAEEAALLADWAGIPPAAPAAAGKRPGMDAGMLAAFKKRKSASIGKAAILRGC